MKPGRRIPPSKSTVSRASADPRRDAVDDNAVRDEHVDVRHEGARKDVGNGAVREAHLGGLTVRGGVESALKLLARHRGKRGLRGLKHGFFLS